MFLAEPQRTPYDFHFQVFGFDVRVSPFFWLAAALLGWELTAGTDGFLNRIPSILAQSEGAISPEYAASLRALSESNPGQGVLLLIWIAAVFASILIHELGHAIAMRYYGIDSYVVLYHFGGLAVPTSASSLPFMGRGGRNEPKRQIAISAAGPGAQLVLASAILFVLQLSGRSLPFPVPFVEHVFPLTGSALISSAPLMAILYFLILPSVFWALLNLLPIYPLDGGQISRELFTLFGGSEGIRNSLILSVLTAGGVAVYGFMNGDMFLAMMFAMLAFSSYQILQAYSGRGGFGPW